MSALNYHHLRYFWAVAHDGNLTRTAERLHLSQSALSVQIRKLEEQLGHALFERRGRAAAPDRGRAASRSTMPTRSSPPAGSWSATLARTGGSRRPLRVGALATLSRNFQMQFLRPVLGLADVEVVLALGQPPPSCSRSLETLSLDVVLLNRAGARSRGHAFVSHRLAEQQVSLVAVPDRLTAGPAAELIATQPVILPSAESGIRIGFDALCGRLGVRPRIAAEADDMAMMRLLAREGVGLAVLPPIVVRDELESGLLVEAAALPGVTETFYAVTMDRRFPNPLLPMLIPPGLQA